MKIIIVECPYCGEENEIDIEENDSIVCDGCDRILNVYDENGKYKIS
jgi:uncharacterized Zn-finger protein